MTIKIHTDTIGTEILNSVIERSTKKAYRLNRMQSIKYLLSIKNSIPEAYAHHRNKHLAKFANINNSI